ncbi:MAG: hypothetical protein ACKVT0_20155 [Planctomycetaceae bacterium]
MSRKRSATHKSSVSQTERRNYGTPSPTVATASRVPGALDPPPVADAPWSIWSKSLVALLFVWVFLLGVTPLRDTDIWWHLRTGAYIWNEGIIPQTDLYTYTDWDQPWIDLHWGFQLLMLAVYSIAGVKGMVLFKAAALTSAVAIGWFAAGRTLSPVLRSLCWIAPIVCMSGRALERPEMLSLIFLGYWLWVIPRLESRPNLIWTLPVVQLVWVNCHALFILGLVVGGAYVVDRLLRWFFSARRGLSQHVDQPPFIHLFRAGMLTLVACFVNPYFEEGAFFPAVLYRKFSVDQNIYGNTVGEFMPPLLFLKEGTSKYLYLDSLKYLYLDAELLVFAVTFFSFLWLAYYRRWHPYRWLLFIAFSHLAWEASRNTNIFSLVSGVLLVANLEDIFRWHRSRAVTASPQPWLGTRRLEKVGLAIVMGLIVSVLTGHWAAFGKEGKRLDWNEERAWFIHDAAKFAGRPGMPMTAYVSNFGQAAVYLYHNGPERRVFIDGRLEVARKETYLLNDAILEAMATINPHWEQALKDLSGDLPVVILDSRFSRAQINGMLNTPGWRLVFADQSAAVFLTEATANRLQLPEVDSTPLHDPPKIESPR